MTDIQLTFNVANLISNNYQITNGLYQHDNTLAIDFKKNWTLGSLFNEFVCKLGFVWLEWAYECQKSPIHTRTS
jgi:hypothetical protein